MIPLVTLRMVLMLSWKWGNSKEFTDARTVTPETSAGTTEVPGDKKSDQSTQTDPKTKTTTRNRHRDYPIRHSHS